MVIITLDVAGLYDSPQGKVHIHCHITTISTPVTELAIAIDI